LPCLSTKSTVYPGCCLALSVPLLAHLHALLPQPPALTLSIGSGYGLLEAILLNPPYNVNIVGVEVQPSPNTHLPHTRHRTVPGSRFLEPLAQEAGVWMFAYPRRVGLLDEYLREHGGGKVEMVVWIGPTMDWEDYRGCFEEWQVEAKSAEEVGGRAWEVIAVARKS
ncbi:hypothetical protein BU23DRAFT_395967, partial [Bimuria novae-zelandiae CBS 107.79]